MSKQIPIKDIKHVHEAEQPTPHYFGLTASAFAESLREGFDMSDYVDLKYEVFPILKPQDKLSVEDKKAIEAFEKTHDMDKILKLLCRMTGHAYLEVIEKAEVHGLPLTHDEAVILGAMGKATLELDDVTE